MINTIIASLLLIALLITACLFVFTLRRYGNKKVICFIMLIACVFCFTFGYLLEITASDTNGAFLGHVFFCLGGSFTPSLFLLFTLDFYGIKLKRWHFTCPLLISALMTLLVGTSAFHKLFFLDFYFTAEYPVHHLQIIPGPFYYVDHIFAYICVILACAVIVFHCYKFNPKFQGQGRLLLIGIILPITSNTAFLLKFNAYGINFTPISMVIVIILLYIELLHYNMLDLIPKATELALNAMKDALLILDGELRYISANLAFFEIFPQTVGITEGFPIESVTEWPKELRGFDSIPAEKNDLIPFSLRSDGQTSCLNASISKILMPSGAVSGWIILIRDISDTVSLMNKLENMAYTDSLTGIFNRHHFMELAELEFKKSQRSKKPFSIIIFDLDYFKKINDSYGHMAGDEVLKSIARNVRKTLRPYDMLARYGGEEFIILTDMNEKNATELAIRVKDEIGNTAYSFEDVQIKCTASFGVAGWDDNCETLETIIQNADMALYRAKKNGRNRVEAYSENKMILEILQAVETDCNGFRLHYQPVFAASSLRCIGAEVLLRWQSPSSGKMVSPDSFIPILKELGQLPTVERWVLNTACAQCKNWIVRFRDPGFFIHVNLSMELLVDGTLYGDVITAVENSGIPANNLVLDFKDFFHMMEFDNGITLLSKLRERNIRIAADCFGSGTSELSHFKNLSVDELRVDRSFVMDIDSDLSSKNLLTGIIRMLKSVEYKICVVGVETGLQREFLQEQNVDMIQGHLLGKPVDAHEFEKRFGNTNGRGVVFMDFENKLDESDENAVIYRHNMYRC